MWWTFTANRLAEPGQYHHHDDHDGDGHVVSRSAFIRYGRGVKVVDAYLGGANVNSSVRFLGSASAVEEVTMHNYYLRGLIR